MHGIVRPLATFNVWRIRSVQMREVSKDSVVSLRDLGLGQQHVESPRGQPSVLVSDKVVLASCERHIAGGVWGGWLDGSKFGK